MDDILIIILIFYVSLLLVSCAIPEMDEVLCKTVIIIIVQGLSSYT